MPFHAVDVADEAALTAAPLVAVTPEEKEVAVAEVIQTTPVPESVAKLIKERGFFGYED